jgi:tricarballylate dehydrogenase
MDKAEIETDVVVVGAGNAGLCAALAARDGGARVVLLERAPVDERGGNSAFTGGGVRAAYQGVDQLKELLDLSPEEAADADWGSYQNDTFYDDIARVTDHRADPDLAELLVTRSFDTLKWMRGKGVVFVPAYSQSYVVNDKRVFWGGNPVAITGGGMGLVNALFAAAEKAGVDIRYQARGTELITDNGIVRGVVVRQGAHDGEPLRIRSKAVVLAAGGFQANTEWRTKYLGPGWDLAKVRGTRFDTGDGIKMALDIGAVSHGNWSGCHAVGWDLNAPEFGDITVGDGFNKHQYPFSIMVNADGERFLDEGADIRNYTYAKYGRVILQQPRQFAWQIFDAKVADLLRPDFYRTRRVTRVSAGTLEDLVTKLDGVDPVRCLKTIHEFNDAVRTDVPFNPTVKDGRGTVGLEIPKSNWANRLDEPPYEAFAVTCGITFTFGGVRVNKAARVLDATLTPIDGLYACGEMVGGLFYFNYPGSTGLTWGAVLGKIAGTGAAQQN